MGGKTKYYGSYRRGTQSQLQLQEEITMDWSKLDVGPGLTEIEHEDFLNLLYKYHCLFCPTSGRTNSVRHVIRTTGPPIRQPPRRLPTALKKVIRPSCSPWSSPVVMVRKPNGLCIDFCKGNDVMHKVYLTLTQHWKH